MPKKYKRQSVKRPPVIQPQDPSYKIIPLTRGQFTLVTTADHPWLNQFNWHAQWNPMTHSFYAVRRKGNHKVEMANEILQCKPGEQADHIFHDTLDNRRENIRKSTPLQNSTNRRINSKNTSGYKGVSWKKQTSRWVAQIKHNGVPIHLGYFFSLEEAAHAYDEAAKKYHGEFAHLNFPC